MSRQIKSQEITVPRLNLWEIPPTQRSYIKDVVTEYRPLTPLDPDAFIQFEIQTSKQEYIQFDRIFLNMKIKVRKMSTITAESDWDDVCPVNYLLHSMIKQIDIFIGDKQISHNTPTYAYKAYLEAFFGFSQDQKSTHLTGSLWYNDEDLKDDIVVKSQTKYLKSYRILDLKGRLHSDLTFQEKDLIGGCKVTIRILLNDPKFYIMANGHTPEIKIIEASLSVHKGFVAEQLATAQDKIIKDGYNALYPLVVNKIKAFSIAKGALDVTIDNVHSGQLPRRIIICMVNNLAYNGEYNLNPYKFQHFNVNMLSVYYDGEQIPPKPYTPDFGNGLIIDEFIDMYSGLDMINNDPTFRINRENYLKGNTFFVFNFAPDLSSGPESGGHLNEIRIGTFRLAMRFEKPLNEAITVLVFCEFDKIMEINAQRQALLDNF